MKMTKAKKGLIITLFAAMMVFAFGATSAFATAGDTVWDPTDAYASGTVENSDGVAVKYNAKRTWASDGLITAQMWTPAVAGAPDPAPIGDAKQFYDLNNAFVGIGTTQYDTWTYDQLATGFDEETGEVAASQYSIVLVQPSYTEGYVATNVDKKVMPNNNIPYVYPAKKQFNVHVYAEGFDPASYEEQTVTLKTEIYGAQSSYAALLYGAVPDQKVVVTARTPAADQLEVTIDGEGNNLLSGTSDITKPYDGETHALVANSVPGFSVKYALRNEKTRVYEDKDSVEFRNAGTYKVRMQRWNDTTKKAVGDYVERKIIVQPAAKLAFGFSSDLASNYDDVPAGAEARDFVESNAVKADADEAMAFFDKYFVLTTKVNKANSSLVTWKYDAITDKDAKKAAEEEFATLLGNYNGLDVTSFDASVEIIEGNTQFDDITFTYAPNATYKAKKIKKASKSFTVVAEAKSGNTISYKLTTPNKKISIDSATGKITVKKGLKKGTYKVTVKATTEAGNGYRAAKESVQLTIKIKK
jgi:hypothetical protein